MTACLEASCSHEGTVLVIVEMGASDVYGGAYTRCDGHPSLLEALPDTTVVPIHLVPA